MCRLTLAGSWYGRQAQENDKAEPGYKTVMRASELRHGTISQIREVINLRRAQVKPANSSIAEAVKRRPIQSCCNELTGVTVPMAERVRVRVNFIVRGICAVFIAAGTLRGASAPVSSESDVPSDRPRPVEPPHKPIQRGTRLTLLVGLNLLTYGQYGYNTAVTLPDSRTLQYTGKQSSSGGTVFVGTAITPPAAFRRFTIGLTVEVGGLESWTHSVIPNGVTTPFSEDNLNRQIQRSAINGYPWRLSISPYVEHELGFLLASRVRAGYQYWRQSGSIAGVFPVDSTNSAIANYNVHFLHNSHLVRLSINNHTSLDEGTETSQASQKRGTGFVRQAGLLVGTNRTVMLFVGFGPAWSF